MIFKSLVQSAAAAVAFVAGTASATMAPTYPSPGTVWTVGKQYTLTWSDDGTKPSLAEGWTNFKIDFMTGDNLNQTFLTNVASNLDATKVSNYTWTAPNVDPYSAIYFFMYTNEAGDAAWTTRFAIVAKDGDTPAPAPEQKQPSGEAIPWGNGQLVGGSASSAAAPASSSSSASSSAAAASSPASSPASAATNGAAASAASSSVTASAESSSSSSSTSASPSASSQSGASIMSSGLVQVAVALVLTTGYILA